MSIYRLLVLFAVAVATIGQSAPPSFLAEDVRPHGADEPHPLVPGLLTWIFGSNLARAPGCSVENPMDPTTYRRELCDTQVLVGGIAAELIFVSERQINLILPDRQWEDRMVDFQVIHNGRASAVVPVQFGPNRPVVSLAAPAYAGMPVWVRVNKPWGMGQLRYPFRTEPWDLGSGQFEVWFEGEQLNRLPVPHFFWNRIGGGASVGLPGPVPAKHLGRLPLHLVYRLDRAGTYRVRYTGSQHSYHGIRRIMQRDSKWTDIEILPSTADQRRTWFQDMADNPPGDVVELLTDYLPSLLASNDAPALRILGRYLDYPDPLVQRYAGNALHYFDEDLRKRVVPGRQPPNRIRL